MNYLLHHRCITAQELLRSHVSVSLAVVVDTVRILQYALPVLGCKLSLAMDSVPFRHGAVHTNGYRGHLVAMALHCSWQNAAWVNVYRLHQTMVGWSERHSLCGRAEGFITSHILLYVA